MLPDFGWTELLVIAIVLIVVVGPKDLPRVVRGFSKSLGSLRRMAGDFRKQFDDALSEAELDDLKTLASDVKEMDPRSKIKDALNPLGEIGKDINKELKGVAKSIESDLNEDASTASSKSTPQGATPQLSEASTGSSTKKAVTKKPAARKSTAKKPAATKTAGKTTASNSKAVSTKAAASKAPAKKAASARKPAAKRTTTAKKPAAKKAGEA